MRCAGYLVNLLHTRMRGWMCIATCLWAPFRHLEHEWVSLGGGWIIMGYHGRCIEAIQWWVSMEHNQMRGESSLNTLKASSNLNSHLCYDPLLNPILQLIHLFIRKWTVHTPVIESVAFTLSFRLGMCEVVNLGSASSRNWLKASEQNRWKKINGKKTGTRGTYQSDILH